MCDSVRLFGQKEMRFNKLILVLAVLCLCHAAQSASILALFSSLSFADHYTYRGYVEMLARNGHSVVVMTPYPGYFQYPEVEKIVELDVSKESSQYLDEYRKLMTNVDDYFPKMRQINELAIKVAIAQLRSQQMTAVFINPNVVFDLVITEAEMPMLYAAAEKYKAPHIAITSGSGSLTMYESKGTPNHPLFYPDLYTIFYEKFNIWEKLAEYLRYLRIRNEYYNNYLPLCQIAAEKIFGLKRDLLSVEHDIDLLFVSGTQTLIGNRPTSPAVIYTDRLHIKPGLALPQELKVLMDGAENGCVYFSLGVIQEANQLSKAMIQTLLDAFGQLPFLVFWKIDDVTAFKKPNNVITQGWFPQQEMLAHPKMKAFITSGGAHSLDEAVFYGVPIIGLPIVSSRKVFIAQITKYGAGEIMEPNFLNKETIVKTVTAVATQEKYKNSVVRLAQWTNHPVATGAQQALWWTEYVLRHGGARHMHSPTVGVPISKYFSFDIMLFFFIIGFIVIQIAFRMLRFVITLIRKKLRSNKETDGKFKAL